MHVTFCVVYSLSNFFFYEAITNIFCCQQTFILSLLVHGLSVISTTERVLLEQWQSQLVFVRCPAES